VFSTGVGDSAFEQQRGMEQALLLQFRFFQQRDTFLGRYSNSPIKE